MSWSYRSRPSTAIGVALIILALLGAGKVHAQSVSNPPTPGCGMGQAVPQAEAVGGAVGTSTNCIRQDAKLPRITRAATCTLNASAACTVTWDTPLVAPAGVGVVITPVNTPAANPIACNLTAVPNTTGASIKCWLSQSTVLSLSLVTAGLTLNPFQNALSGTQVQILAIPLTQ